MSDLGSFMVRVSGLDEPWHLEGYVGVLERLGGGEGVRVVVATRSGSGGEGV